MAENTSIGGRPRGVRAERAMCEITARRFETDCREGPYLEPPEGKDKPPPGWEASVGSAGASDLHLQQAQR